MWSRIRRLKVFNQFFLFLILCLSIVLPLEIFRKISSGIAISRSEYLDYALIWVMFVLGAIFINIVDAIVEALLTKIGK